MKHNNENELARVAAQFQAFFDAYYDEHHEVKSLALKEMKDGAGIYAVLDYGSFRQFVNYYRKEYSAQTVNACFELTHDGHAFLCHFDDILDELMSGDISFYTYQKCVTAEQIETALKAIMDATQQYFNDITSIAASPARCASVFNEVFGWEIEEENGSEDFELPTVPEEVSDFTFFIHAMLGDPVAMKKELVKKHKKNKLETKFEKRAYAALADVDMQTLKKEKKSAEKAEKYPLKYRLIMAIPYVIAAVIAAPLFFVVGIKADSAVFSGCIGRYSGDTAFVFAVIGICLAEALCLLLHRPLEKLFSGKHLETIRTMSNAELTKGSVIVMIILLLAAAGALYYFEFNGMAFKNGQIVYKPNGIAAVQEYSFDDTDIARIQNEDETIEEYAFCFDGEWVDYYALEKPEQQLISEKLAGRDIKTYDYFEDIDE